MLFNVLKNDLRRKKSINLLLFLFIIFASMLMAGSGTVLYTTSNAISRMIKEANVPDILLIAHDNAPSNQSVEIWADASDLVQSYENEKYMLIMTDALSKDGKVIVDDDYAGTSFFSSVPKEHSLIFDQKDQPLSLNPGEFAIPMTFHKKYDVNIGDQIKLKIDGMQKDFIVTALTKDIVFGSDMISNRFVFSEEDYIEIQKSQSKDALLVNIWSITVNPDVTYPEIASEVGNNTIDALFLLGINDIDTFYLVSKLVSMVMIVVSLSLILISFLILRFTIIFTIQEDYRAIGIMKGLGIRSLAIRGIYLVKYFTISIIGGAIGLGLSFIYSRIMLESTADFFLISANQTSIWISIVGSLTVIILSVVFCTLCTRKINKVSVVEAIRRGHSGESFSKSQKISLYKKKRLVPSDYLSVSDLLNGFKKFAILTITFILGTLLMIVPLNLINTLKAEDSMMSIMGLPPFDVYVMSDEALQAVIAQDLDGLDRELLRLEKLFEGKGYPIDIHAEIGKRASIYTDDPDQSISVDVMQGQGYDINKYTYLNGTAPLLDNEIAVSSKIAKHLGLVIGDTLTVKISEDIHSFMITAIYPALRNTGLNVRVNESFPMPSGNVSQVDVFGDYKNDSVHQEQALDDMQKSYPDISLGTQTDLYNRYIGSSVSAVDSMKNLIVGVVLGIIFMISCLIVRILISREIPEVALLKSIGFRRFQLQRWQIGRIALVLVFSILIGTTIAGPVSSVVLNAVFSMLGVPEVQPVIDPLQVYLIYPLALLFSTTIAAAISIGQIKKTQVWEINNQE